MGPYPRSRRAVIRPYKDMPPQLGPDGVFQRPAFTGNDRGSDALAHHRVSLLAQSRSEELLSRLGRNVRQPGCSSDDKTPAPHLRKWNNRVRRRLHVVPPLSARDEPIERRSERSARPAVRLTAQRFADHFDVGAVPQRQR